MDHLYHTYVKSSDSTCGGIRYNIHVGNFYRIRVDVEVYDTHIFVCIKTNTCLKCRSAQDFGCQ